MRVEELSGMILPRLLARRVQEHPDAALVVFDGQPLSYRQADAASRAVAAFLRRSGVGRGDRVGILLDNGPDFIAAWFGICRNGSIEVPLNTSLKGRQLEYNIANCGMRVLVIERAYLPRLAEIALPPALEMLVVAGEDGEPFPGVATASFSEVTAVAAADFVDAELAVMDPAAIVYTSGTTGPSKGVICPHGQLLGIAMDTIAALEIGPDDVLYDAHPLYHAHSQGQAVMLAMVADIPLYMRRSFSASGFIADIVAYGITTAYLIGAAGLVLKQPPSAHDRAHRLRVVCAVPIPRDHKRPLEERFGVPVIDLYGMTETGIISCNPLDAAVEGSCGLPTPHRQLCIVDELGQPVPAGTPGQVLVRPTVPWAMFLGYWEMPEKTLEVMGNLWFHTGDKAWLDPQGYVHFVGRIKDSIRRRGENISAFEVEQTINSHEGILESAVLPYPSPLGEDDLWVVAVRRPGAAALCAEELLSFCEGALPRHAVPRYIQFVDRFPKTPTERIEKYKLQQQGLGPDAYDREAAEGRRA